MVVEIENFFGVYCLYCINPKYKGQTYIGFTVDPNRRVNQHNKGRQAGGAKRTSGRGPWDMVLIIHGFPNQIAALRFEWAWQNPKTSRRLKHITGKKKSESGYDFKLRIVSEMLRTGPWNRLPLTIRWLKQEYQKDFALDKQPPAHMPLAYGLVKSRKVTSPTKTQKNKSKDDRSEICEDDELMTLTSTQSSRPRCAVCSHKFKPYANKLQCLMPECRSMSHTMCLAKVFLGTQKDQLIPVEGQCPRCKQTILWGDLIRLKSGCYQTVESNAALDEHWAEDLDLHI